MSKEFENFVIQKLGEITEKISDLDEIRQKVSKIDEIEKKVSKIDEIEKKVSEIDEMKKVLNNVVKDVKDLKEDVSIIKSSVVLMEHKLNTDLPALFEIYEVNYGTQKRNENKMDSLEIDSNNYSIRIENLEKITKDHSEKIKKLLSQR